MKKVLTELMFGLMAVAIYGGIIIFFLFLLALSTHPFGR